MITKTSLGDRLHGSSSTFKRDPAERIPTGIQFSLSVSHCRGTRSSCSSSSSSWPPIFITSGLQCSNPTPLRLLPCLVLKKIIPVPNRRPTRARLCAAPWFRESLRPAYQFHAKYHPVSPCLPCPGRKGTTSSSPARERCFLCLPILSAKAVSSGLLLLRRDVPSWGGGGLPPARKPCIHPPHPGRTAEAVQRVAPDACLAAVVG